MLGRSYSWLDQGLRAGQFVAPDGNSVQPLRTPGGYLRFTLPMLRAIVVASARQGWFSVEDIRYALRAVIEASYPNWIDERCGAAPSTPPRVVRGSAAPAHPRVGRAHRR